MELMLASLATCAGATIESILEKMRLDVADLVVAVDAVRATKVPRAWTDVRLRYLVRGELAEDRLDHAAKLADRTCSASVMLERATNLSHETFLVRAVSEHDTVAVRHAILRTGMPIEAVTMRGDESAAWFGALHQGVVVGTAGVFDEASPDGGSAHRLRAMATMPAVRGVGLGEMLLEAAIDHVVQASGGSLWCSARTTATEFYTRRGFEVTSEEYDVSGIGPHVRMRLTL